MLSTCCKHLTKSDNNNTKMKYFGGLNLNINQRRSTDYITFSHEKIRQSFCLSHANLLACGLGYEQEGGGACRAGEDCMCSGNSLSVLNQTLYCI